MLAFLAIFLTAAAYSGQAHAQTYRFSSVSVEGNQRIEPATIVSYAGIARGQQVSAAELNQAYSRIQDSGLFEKVEVIPQGSRLVIKVKEFPTINRIAFEGNRRLKDDDLKKMVESRVRQVFNPTKADRDAEKISQAYAQDGRVSARVTPKIIRRSENRVDLVFEIFEGRQIEIQRISFVGNKAYSDRRLRRAINSKQAGILRALISSDTFVEDRVKFDSQVLTDFYNSRGYVDFHVTGTNAQLTRARDAYFLTFNVEEGQQFHFGKITTESQINGVDAKAYQDTLKIKPGVVYSPVLVDNSIARMERLGVKQGVDFLRVEPQVTRNDRDLTLDVKFVLKRGPRVFVERIDIEGNTTTMDRVIRREFDAVEGDPFNPRQIRQAADRIRALRFFKTVDVNAHEGSRPDQVVVDVNVEETTTGSVSAGLSYSTNDGPGVQFGFSERNFMGRGQGLTANVAVFGNRVNYDLDFTEPAFLGRDVGLGLKFAYQTTSKNNNALFDTSLGQFRPRLSFPVSENGRLGVYYDAQYQDMSNYRPVTGTGSGILATEINRGAEWLSGVGYDYTYDTRKTGLNPSAGVKLSFGQEFTGLGGSVDSVKTTFSAIGQTKVMREDVTLRATFEGGALNTFNGSSRFINRFNHQVIRGFQPNGMGPNEVNGGLTQQLGGNYYSAIKLEADFPLGLPDEWGVTGGVYYDIGSLWGVNTSNASGVVNSDNFKPRQTIGFSLFWKSPFGPLQMNFSHVVQKQTGDRTQFFDLAVRTDF